MSDELLKLILKLLNSLFQERGNSKPRKSFSKITKQMILMNQNYSCKACKKKLEEGAIEYHHIDGNRSNNSLSNCEALCSNCHSKKTRKKHN